MEDQTVHFLIGVTSALAAIVCAYVILSPRIEEGLIVKAGLMLMFFGLAVTAYFAYHEIESWRGLRNADLLLRGGLCFVIGGHYLKRRAAIKCGAPPVSDWTPLDNIRRGGGL
jgi:hypothetical protein